jgi:hypothetical protein
MDKIFSGDEISELLRVIDGLDDTKYNIVKKDAIKSKISMLNDAPLMGKFTQLRTQLGVHFSEWELNILKIARRKRTDLIHGKSDIEIKEDELNKLRTILEKMLVVKISMLKSSSGNNHFS